MALRTFSFWGKAYAPQGSVSLMVDFNGVTVHNAVVNTTAEAIPTERGGSYEKLFSWEMDELFWPNIGIPVHIQVSGGDFFFVGLGATKFNSRDLDGEYFIHTPPPLLPMKRNVHINDVLVDVVEPEYDWHYHLEDGFTMDVDLFLPPPQAGTPTGPDKHYTGPAGVYKK